jgi:Fe-Mn family superoxide dismutase
LKRAFDALNKELSEKSNVMQQQRHIIQIPCKPWTLNGLSDRLLVSHYENNYGAAVQSLNSIWDRLADLDPATASGYELRALKREELMAMGSVTLHELYFGSLGGDGAVLFTGSGAGTKLADSVSAALEQQFGSIAAWQREFVALAEALNGGSGWVVLTYARQDGKLYNQLAFDDSRAITDAVPLLVLDMYEHAYQTEFGANTTAYIDAFMRNVDWTVVADRLRRAGDRDPVARDSSGVDGIPSISPEELAAQRARGAPLQIIDARPRYHFSRSSDMMDGAVYRDPERVYEWASELSTETPVVVYCSYGFNVGCAVTGVLRERGFDARFLSGGLSAWYGAGGARSLRPDPVSSGR